jgi:hypothetical protein
MGLVGLEFESEQSVIMAWLMPINGFEFFYDFFGFLIIKSDYVILTSCGEL